MLLTNTLLRRIPPTGSPGKQILGDVGSHRNRFARVQSDPPKPTRHDQSAVEAVRQGLALPSQLRGFGDVLPRSRL